jgi:hypothetical protein
MPRPGPARVGRIIAVWAVGVLAVFGVGRAVVAMPQHCGTGEAAEWRAAAEAAVGWFATNQQADGTFTYRYDAETGAEPDEYNWVRHAGVLLSLEQAETAGVATAAPVADRARARVFQNITRAGDVAALRNGAEPTAGGTALLVAALAERHEHRADTTDDELLRALGRYLVAQVQPGGQVDEYSDPATLAPERGTPSIFTTSEVAFALARMERLFPGEGFGEPVRTITHYVSTRRALDAGVVPDLGDHWMAYAMSEIVRWPDPQAARLTGEELAWGRKQMGIVGVMTRFESQRTQGWQDEVRRGGVSIGSAVGTHGEALNGWVLVAGIEPALRPQLANVVSTAQCNAGLLAERQVTPEEAAEAPDPEKAQGAWLWEGVTQMDDQQHALSALVMATDRVDPAVLEVGGQLPRRAPVPESPWLMFVVALAALNPLRLALGSSPRPRSSELGSDSAPLGADLLPRTDESRWARVGAAGIVGTAVLAGLGFAGDWVWRTLDVSIPVGVIGGALAVTVGALLTAVWPLPRVGEAADGRWGWFVPHLIPLTLRPELLALTLAAGAAGRGWPFALGLLAAVAMATAIARVTSSSGVITTWLARVMAVVALVAGVAMIVDAIYAV